ncbi:Dynein heavy chain domain-1, partial [Trinorchestia longiramus]
MKDIKEIFTTAREFLKIEKVEFGGPKGKELGHKLSTVFSEFNEAYSAFSIRTYDCLDPDELEFVCDHREFTLKVRELEQRMSLIVEQAFNDTATPTAFLTVVQLLGSFIQRPILKAQFS